MVNPADITNLPTDEAIAAVADAAATADSAADATSEVEAAIANPEPLRVKVKVELNGTITSTHPLPSRQQVLQCLPKDQLKKIDRYNRRWGNPRDLVRTYADRIPAAVWSNAIAQATIQQLTLAPSAETEMTPLTQDAYFTIGGNIFKLNPVGVVRANAALTTARRHMRESIAREQAVMRQAIEAKREEMLEAARQSAEALTAHAHRLEQQATEKLRQLNRQAPPPQWMVDAGIPIRHHNDSSTFWGAAMICQIKLQTFSYKHGDREYRWQLPADEYAALAPVRFMVWVLLTADGKYNQRSCRLDNITPILPHMSTASACMSIGDAPDAITSFDSLDRLRLGIERCFREVNLNSLLSACDRWLPTLKQFVPPALLPALQGSHDRLYNRLNSLIAYQAAADEAAQATVAEADESGNELWTV